MNIILLLCLKVLSVTGMQSTCDKRGGSYIGNLCYSCTMWFLKYAFIKCDV